MKNNDEGLEYLVGNAFVLSKPQEPFSSLILQYLEELSKALLKDHECRNYSEIVTLGFWCRKSNIIKIKEEYKDKSNRIGLGKIFHIAPSNVPINFAYSYIWGLLSGNANIVKVSSKPFPVVDIVCRIINSVLMQPHYKSILDQTAIIRYSRFHQITQELCRTCDARIIWGGDQTISKVRKYEIPIRSKEIVFSDRYSICMINPLQVYNLDSEKLKRLAENFYNDTYLMDQNACSSPHLIVWLVDERDSYMKNEIQESKKRFWDAVSEVVSLKYQIDTINIVNKYMQLNQDAIRLNQLASINEINSKLYRIQLHELSDNMDSYRGQCGYYYEYETKKIEDVLTITNKRYQTITYFGINKNLILNEVLNHHLLGIDRIVPIGQALTIGMTWDGYDIISELSRKIECY